MYAYERPRYVLSENGVGYYAMTHCFVYWDIRVWNQRILLNFWVSIFFYIWYLITDISLTVAQILINDTPFWKSAKRTFRNIYVNCFKKLWFYAEGSTKFLKMHFFGQLKDRKSGRKHGNWANDLFPLLFPLQLFVTLIFVFENSQNSFSSGLPFGPFWSAKYHNFGQKLPIWRNHFTFLESRHSDVK